MSIRTLTLYLNLIVTVYCYNVKLTAGINLLDTFTYIIYNFYWETSQIFLIIYILLIFIIQVLAKREDFGDLIMFPQYNN